MAELQGGQTPYHTAEKIGAVWMSLKKPIRTAIIFIGIVTALALIWLAGGNIIPRPMEVLFHRLEPQQAREVVTVLEESAIPYRIADGGSTILVPRDQRDRLRLTISPDLYAQGAGFALFEGNGLVSSDYERRVQWQIALEEELRRTITSIAAVDQARVHLVIPAGSLFVRERGTPSASIFLRLKPMTSLSEAQVRGVLSLVAGSVEGLRPENVNIVDSHGNILYDAFAAIDGQPFSGAVQDRLKLKRQFERELENRLRTILEQVYGPGKALAMVTAELDFDIRERTVITYDREPVERSVSRVEERSEGTGAAPDEVGEPNIPGYEGAAGRGEYSHERIEEIINYEIGNTREFIASAPGRVLRLSTAVVIDNPAGGEAMQEQVSALVVSALGFDGERGDTLSIQMLPFDDSWREGWEAEPDAPFALEKYIPYLPVALVVLALVIAGAIFLGRRRSRQTDTVFIERPYVPEQPREEISPEDKWRNQVRKLADEEPAGVAGLIKTWLVEE